ncbi:MAG TPA: FAD-dependent oxidoreductase [Gemmatimonadaceae bacterium]
MPCGHGRGCPLGVDVPAMVSAVRQRDVARAHQIARGPNPFASSCGRGCHAPCETACRRRHAGSPVAIAELEAYAATSAAPDQLAAPGPCTSAHDLRSVAGLVGRGGDVSTPAPRSGKRVAIIGAGVTGLACAHDLALLGHDCAIFDASEEPGGVLTTAVPDFRFPVASIRAECAAILARGATYHRRTRIERSDGVRALLREGFDAVFIAIGASDARGPVVEQQSRHPAVVDAMDVLRTSDASPAGSVVVVGDGDLALDAARTLVRRATPSAKPGGTPAQHATVHLVHASELEDSPFDHQLLAAALVEGVELHHGWRPRRLLLEDDGSTVPGIEVTRDGGEITKVIPCDQLVVAATRVPAAHALDELLACTPAGLIAVDVETLRTSIPNVWAGGACALGHRSIAHAVADGKRAAWQMHAALTGVQIRVQLASAWVEVNDRDRTLTQRALATPRAAPERPGVSERHGAGTPTAAYADEMLRQATRCYDCTVLPVVDDSCTRCGACVTACPVGAFTLIPDAGEHAELRFDQEPCTRCGICVEHCPEGAIAMVRAVWEERLVAERVTRSRRRAV